MASEKKDKLEPQIKSVDMAHEGIVGGHAAGGCRSWYEYPLRFMRFEANCLAIEAMEKYHIEKDIAQYIKREVRAAQPNLRWLGILQWNSLTLAKALHGTVWWEGTLEAL
ncbi:hypothetical protein AN0420.2 [Aspergillus nidulans FGSC A4]|nr:hypothetical protein AN0420.2 [Aspergillus nidulans FGSC A4]|eukprot:XP_658024.1 hypothetical protein AN0420.2 [Aspergillus nidulans FGSC A4]